MRRPLLMLFGGAVFWLLVGALAGVLADAKLVWPGFLDNAGWLSFGRLRPVADEAILYGWASQAGLAVMLWLLARLGGAQLRWPVLLTTAILLWNAGVSLGVCGILVGQVGAMPGLEFSGSAAAILAIAFLLIGMCALFLLCDRTSPLFVSQWYLLAALLCFPWLYGTANALLVWHPIPGPAQAVIAGWFHGGIFWLWLIPVGLAWCYYVIPTITQRPIHAYPSSVLAFRGLVVLGGWTGLERLVGGPVPAWMVSAALAACMMMVLPVTVMGINLFGTLRLAARPRPPVLGFTIFALLSLFVATSQSALTALVAPITQLTDYSVGEEMVRILGFASMSLFAAMYFIVPQLVGREFPAEPIRRHFFLAAASIGLMFAAASFGGAPFLRFLFFLGSLGFLAASLLFAGSLGRLLFGENRVAP